MRKGKFFRGVLLGAVLGAVGGLFLASKSGSRIKGDIKARAADFYAFAAPRLKALKNVGEKEYTALMKVAAGSYARARRFSKKEASELAAEAIKSWKHVAAVAKHAKR